MVLESAQQATLAQAARDDSRIEGTAIFVDLPMSTVYKRNRDYSPLSMPQTRHSKENHPMR